MHLECKKNQKLPSTSEYAWLEWFSKILNHSNQLQPLKLKLNFKFSIKIPMNCSPCVQKMGQGGMFPTPQNSWDKFCCICIKFKSYLYFETFSATK